MKIYSVSKSIPKWYIIFGAVCLVWILTLGYYSAKHAQKGLYTTYRFPEYLMSFQASSFPSITKSNAGIELLGSRGSVVLTLVSADEFLHQLFEHVRVDTDKTICVTTKHNKNGRKIVKFQETNTGQTQTSFAVESADKFVLITPSGNHMVSDALQIAESAVMF